MGDKKSMSKSTSYPKLPQSRDELDSGWAISWLMVVRNGNKWTRKQKYEWFKKRNIKN